MVGPSPHTRVTDRDANRQVMDRDQVMDREQVMDRDAQKEVMDLSEDGGPVAAHLPRVPVHNLFVG